MQEPVPGSPGSSPGEKQWQYQRRATGGSAAPARQKQPFLRHAPCPLQSRDQPRQHLVES